jgi:hypothetical protein
LLGFSLLSWLVQGILRRRLAFREGRLFWPVAGFFAMVILGLVRGASSGGDLYIAFWESRYLFYVPISYVLAVNTMRRVAHVRTLVGVGLVGMTLFAIEGAWRRLALIDSGIFARMGAINEDFWYDHDVVIFLGAVLLLGIAQLVFGGPRWQRLLSGIGAPIAMFTLLATQRRAGYIAVAVAFLAYAVIFLVSHRKAFFLLAVPILVGMAIYLPVFWNHQGMLGQPARAVRSMVQPNPEDARSNEYRAIEKFNVIATIQANPAQGVGFGREFYFVIPLPDLSWWQFWHFEPHHNILWIWLKTGALGFIAFWVLMGSALTRGAHLVKVLRQPDARVFALLAIGGVVMALVFSYVDLGLVNGRVTFFMGTLLGTLAVLDQMPDETPLKGRTSP